MIGSRFAHHRLSKTVRFGQMFGTRKYRPECCIAVICLVSVFFASGCQQFSGLRTTASSSVSSIEDSEQRASVHSEQTPGTNSQGSSLPSSEDDSEPIRAVLRGQSPPAPWEPAPGNSNAYRQPMHPANMIGPNGSTLLTSQGTAAGVPPVENAGNTISSFQGPQNQSPSASGVGVVSPFTAPPPMGQVFPVQEPIHAFPQMSPSGTVSSPPYNPVPNYSGSAPPSLNQPWSFGGTGSPGNVVPPVGPGLNGYMPRVRDVPIDVILSEGQTGRFMVGGSVNTDLGVAGQVVLEERNFDIRKFPTSFRDLFHGAFRGNGEDFRLELVPGNRVQRYSVNWTQPNLFGYSPYNLSVGGYYFNRIYRDWSEQRLGGRMQIGYAVTPDLSISSELRGEEVKVYDPRILGVPALDSVLGDNELYTARFRLAHNTRDSPFLPTEGHFLELIYDQVMGSYDYPRGQINYSRYFLIRERPDGTGRHTLTSSHRFGVTGSQTPIFENFFAGGFTTLRGFRFRGAGPVQGGIQTGGQLLLLGTLEYMFPLSADDAIRMITFVDYGTVEEDISIRGKNFRVAPGFGFRVSVPAMGPAPLAFDFAFPVKYADFDERQVFSFSVGLTR